MKHKNLEEKKQHIVLKIVRWMMNEKKDAYPHARYFPAWEIKKQLETEGGKESWWGGEMRNALRDEIENYYDDLYLGYMGPIVGYILTSDKTIAAGLIPALLSIAEGLAEALNNETLSAENQARLDGVVKALAYVGKDISDLHQVEFNLPDETIHKLEEREKLLLASGETEEVVED